VKPRHPAAAPAGRSSEGIPVQHLNEDVVVRVVRSYIESLFPRACTNCGRQFRSLRDYLQNTTHLESPIVYDDLNKEIPAEPLGPIAFANCSCGTTLTVGSLDMPPAQLVELLTWARIESASRSITVRELLRQIRDRIDEQVLRDDT
jgi:hypothetical protein